LERLAAERGGAPAAHLAALDHRDRDDRRVVEGAEAGEPGVRLRALVLGRAGLAAGRDPVALEGVEARPTRGLVDPSHRLPDRRERLRLERALVQLLGL